MKRPRLPAVLWSLPVRKVFEQLRTGEAGLSDEEAHSRLAQYGFNEIPEKGHRNILHIIVSQFSNALVLVLLVAAAVSYFLDQRTEAMVIFAILMLNSCLGFYQEYRAERAVRELKRLVSSPAKVVRSGREAEIDARRLVPGDIVHLAIGDVIPADLRLIKADNLTTDESSLTGESMPVLKRASIEQAAHSLPQYLSNVAFMGTSVASGYGFGVVIAAGPETFFGKTASHLGQAPAETEFHRSIRRFSNFLLKVILVMTVFIFVSNAFLGKGVFDSLLFALALAVGITPEILPIIITITLSHGALRMAREKVITKRLTSVEDLGNMDVLCCDKTGTLTEGKVSLKRAVGLDGKNSDLAMTYGLLCSPELIHHGRRSSVNPMDQALWDSPLASKARESAKGFTVLDENEFDFHRRRKSAVVKGPTGTIMVVKGAPESILSVCRSAGSRRKSVALRANVMERFQAMVDGFSAQGFRVLAVAFKRSKNPKTSVKDESGLTLIGFLLFEDPAKDTAKEALRVLNQLGVRIKVVTGDNPIVARKVCGDVGLSIDGDRIVTGDEIEKADNECLDRLVRSCNVFARATPEHKFRIVSSLSRQGHVVGFLGDGINDAPALKAADVGISVDSAAGIAKEAADIILLKKSLRVLAHGITEGRKIFGNITKYILNTISANFGNMMTVAASSLFLPFIPLLPVQILLNNFISDVPMLSISTDNVDAEFVRRPKRWNIGLISEFMGVFGLISTFFDLALILPLIYIFYAAPPMFRTAWFVESALSEILIVFAVRTKLRWYQSHPSRTLVWVSIIAAVAIALIPFTALGASLFSFTPLPKGIIAYILVVLAAYFAAVEFAKRRLFQGFEL